MPELPEVQTTVSGLQSVLPGKKITDVWTDWVKTFRPPAINARAGENITGYNIASSLGRSGKEYFSTPILASRNKFHDFKKAVVGRKVLSVTRRGKHILIHLAGNTTVIIHMKMTGHLLYGEYKKTYNQQFTRQNFATQNLGGQATNNKKKKGKETWLPAGKGPLNDPFNRFIHVVFSLSNRKHMAFSDTRKFGKIVLAETDKLPRSPHLAHLGPEPMEKSFTHETFAERLSARPRGKIKTVLMDQTILAGIGNIYSDEMLWLAGIHPEAKTYDISYARRKTLYEAMKSLLKKGISLGGDSMSDYRNIFGERGHFQEKHNVYQKKGEKCGKQGCSGIIKRIVVGGRSAHFCPSHQKT